MARVWAAGRVWEVQDQPISQDQPFPLCSDTLSTIFLLFIYYSMSPKYLNTISRCSVITFVPQWNYFHLLSSPNSVSVSDPLKSRTKAKSPFGLGVCYWLYYFQPQEWSNIKRDFFNTTIYLINWFVLINKLKDSFNFIYSINYFL